MTIEVRAWIKVDASTLDHASIVAMVKDSIKAAGLVLAADDAFIANADAIVIETMQRLEINE